MRWALGRRKVYAKPKEDTVIAAREADRALADAKAMTCKAEDQACTASEVAKSLRATRERNHVGWAVEKAIRGV
ncbi:MAG: hypothetical protein JWO98_4749 [Frankiales bacterium]|jgi:hypothetical protein|nr:hypothetical protein [Frankiales bacterium]